MITTKSPTTTGLMSLPLILGSLAASTFAGHRISATGRWKRYLVAGTILMTVGMLMQNLVLAAQNNVPADALGSATSVLSFSRSMGTTVGTSVLGAVLAHRVATELSAGRAAGGDTPGSGAGHGVSDTTPLPAPLRALVENAYGIATAELFLWATPFALPALIAVLFIEESAIAAGGRALPTSSDTPRDLAEASTRGSGGALRQGSVHSGPGAAAGRRRPCRRGRNSECPGR